MFDCREAKNRMCWLLGHLGDEPETIEKKYQMGGHGKLEMGREAGSGNIYKLGLQRIDYFHY